MVWVSILILYLVEEKISLYEKKKIYADSVKKLEAMKIDIADYKVDALKIVNH